LILSDHGAVDAANVRRDGLNEPISDSEGDKLALLTILCSKTTASASHALGSGLAWAKARGSSAAAGVGAGLGSSAVAENIARVTHTQEHMQGLRHDLSFLFELGSMDRC
jgi:hypothetical protein